MLKLKLIFCFVYFGIFFISCVNETQEVNHKLSESEENKDSAMECDSFMLIRYNKIQIKDIIDLEKIKRDYNYLESNSAAHRAITTLNRKEFRFFRVKDSIIVPEFVNKDLRVYSIFPSCYPGARQIKKIIMISNKYQCYACYEFGKLVRFSAANTGKEQTQTYPGRYALNWRQRLRKSSIDSNWVLPFTWNFHQQAGNAFHQFDMPGRPVSHSCVRQFMQDAEWLYSWGEGSKYDSLKNPIYMSGTPVLIIDNFDYTHKRYKPWMYITSNKDIKISLPDKPMEIEEALIPISQIPKEARGSLKNRQRFETAEQELRNRGIIRPNTTIIETRNFNKERRLKKEKLEKEKIEKEKMQMQMDSSVTN